MRERDIAMLVTGKARRHLRTSTALLLLSMSLVAVFLVTVQHQRGQQERDFGDNGAVRLVEVTRGSQLGVIEPLRFADVAALTAALDEALPAGGHSTTARLELGFGIEDTTGAVHFVQGLDGDGAALLGLDELRPGVAYTVTPTAEAMTLQVPVVDVASGGLSSGSTVPLDLQLVALSPDAPLLALGNAPSDTLFVAGATFRELVLGSFDTDWDDFVASQDGDNPFGVEVLRSISVHVDRLEDVAVAADAAESLGLSTDWTLEAFDDLAGSLRATTRLGLLAVVLTVLGCLAYALSQLESWFRLAHRDIGILRHHGFAEERVRAMFVTRLARTWRTVGVAACTLTGVVGMTVLGPGRAALVVADVVVVAALAMALHLVATRVLLPRHTGLGVLTLLRVDREFE